MAYLWIAVSAASQVAQLFFFFNDTATTEIYTLSLHDALPISRGSPRSRDPAVRPPVRAAPAGAPARRRRDRKSTRLNSSHSQISYAVFCLKKKKQPRIEAQTRSGNRGRTACCLRPRP